MLKASRAEPVTSFESSSDWFSDRKRPGHRKPTVPSPHQSQTIPVLTKFVKVPVTSKSTLPASRSPSANMKPSAPSSTASMSSLSSLSSLSSVDDAVSSKKRRRDASLTRKSNQVIVNTKSNARVGTGAKRRRVNTASEAGTSTSVTREASFEPSARSRSSSTRPRARTKRRTPALTSAELVYRESHSSRSGSATSSEHDGLPLHERVTWTDEDGDVSEKLVSSENVVRRFIPMGKYKPCFYNPQDKNDKSFEPQNFPKVVLPYPNNHADETFLLLEPKDKDHYNPVFCLSQTIYAILEYLSPEQRALFGTPDELLLTSEKAEPCSISQSAAFSPLSSLTSSPSSQTSSLTALSSDDETSPQAHAPQRRSSTPNVNLLRAFERAKHTRDGPAMIAAVEEISKLIRSFKDDPSGNILLQAPKAWSKTGIPQKVVLRIIEETYQRCVGPSIDQLKKYSSFSSEVYGELMPSFISDIIAQTGLGPNSLFLDLGSGVGNVALQATLQTGCSAFGIEVKDGPAALAKKQEEQMRLRCRMWGVKMGDVELAKGDMTTCPRVDELMSKADVVLVNNYLFSPALNNALRPKFLDLKEGAFVVSLKPFAPLSNQRLTERNIDDMSAIFDVSQLQYLSGTVSWSSGSGTYYIHRVDREGYRVSRIRYEESNKRFERTRNARWNGGGSDDD